MFERLFFRVLAVLAFCYFGFALRPLHSQPLLGMGIGLLIGSAVIAIEMRVQHISWGRVAGALAGGLLGACMGFLAAMVLARVQFGDPGTQQFSEVALFLLCAYSGVAAGASKGNFFYYKSIGGSEEPAPRSSYKILDTSVIIDGRIADLADTGFLDGTVVIPQFVLRELQLVADSPDSLKRNRGRRGLDVLQRIQKLTSVKVLIIEEDFPLVREVDLKLIELGKLYKAKVVTNDFNLHKVAQLRGVHVLNINELANALKPIVLPGESMRVFILKEGKEFNQGVAYLDDGTMVVVDNAKRMISKTIDVTVTSVLQTTAGKMIFGKLDERAHAVIERPLRKAEVVGEA